MTGSIVDQLNEAAVGTGVVGWYKEGGNRRFYVRPRILHDDDDDDDDDDDEDDDDGEDYDDDNNNHNNNNNSNNNDDPRLLLTRLSLRYTQLKEKNKRGEERPLVFLENRSKERIDKKEVKKEKEEEEEEEEEDIENEEEEKEEEG
ncbi:hypothetical protein HZH68_010348 [Vespula germanica]|uniref:Uncharacterized protein n=1 Tax=Vespula germanica TaxID=30212 RepID=A0A834N3E1_VESGE|nr:hypothetical protein HZH68_010348 [Vespula germanica]